MWWVDDIFSLVWDISSWFYDAYQYTNHWAWPFNEIAPVFLSIHVAIWNLLTPIAHFGDWVDDVWSRVQTILDFDTIAALLRQWLDWAEWAWEWVTDAWYYVTGWIEDWWAVTQNTVQGWIDAATEGFSDLVAAWDEFWTITWPEWSGNLIELRSLWDDFWVNIFPTLVSFSWLTTWWIDRVKDVQDLINSAFTIRDNLWSGWQEIRDQVLEFFADPYQWMYDRLDEFFERFW